MATYTPINTFEEDAYKSYLREHIFNPLIRQHNAVTLDVTNIKQDTQHLRADLSYMGEGVSKNRVDVSNLETRVFELERESGCHKTNSFTDLDDAPRHLESGKYLRVDASGTRIEFDDGPVSSGGSSGGSAVTSFKALTDTPTTYVGQAGKILKVNGLENGLVYADAPEAGGVTKFTELEDAPSNIPNNMWLKSNNSGQLIFAEAPTSSGGGSSGVTNFTQLNDTPSSIQAGKMLVGSGDGNSLVFQEIPEGGGSGEGGSAGPQGPAGADGVGVPVGGASGQILAKIDGTDYNTEWIDAPAGSVGGAGGEGVDTFIELADTPNSITAGNLLMGNSDGDALEFMPTSGVGGKLLNAYNIGYGIGPVNSAVTATQMGTSSIIVNAAGSAGSLWQIDLPKIVTDEIVSTV